MGFPHFPEEQTQVQRGQVTCPKSLSSNAEPGFSLGLDDIQDCAPDHNSVRESNLHKQKA